MCLQVKSSGNEFQTVGAAWQKARLPNTVLAAATWSKWCSLERRCRGVVQNRSKSRRYVGRCVVDVLTPSEARLFTFLPRLSWSSGRQAPAVTSQAAAKWVWELVGPAPAAAAAVSLWLRLCQVKIATAAAAALPHPHPYHACSLRWLTGVVHCLLQPSCTGIVRYCALICETKAVVLCKVENNDCRNTADKYLFTCSR